MIPTARRARRNKRPVICLDFDGVIHRHLLGWKGRSVIRDVPIDGVKEAIKLLRRRFVVVVHSGRCASGDGIVAIEEWLGKHGIHVDMVCSDKPLAEMYVDDRAIQFNGNWEETMREVMSFRHWQRGMARTR